MDIDLLIVKRLSNATYMCSTFVALKALFVVLCTS